MSLEVPNTPLTSRPRRRTRSRNQLTSFSDDEDVLAGGDSKKENCISVKGATPARPTPKPKPRAPKAVSGTSPLTPIQNVVLAMRQRLEKQAATPHPASCDNSQNPSPGLAKLRSTPGPRLLDKQRALERLHEKSRSDSDKLSGAGGGVAMWPGMESMRLTQIELMQLLLAAATLLAATVVLFYYIHGGLLSRLIEYHEDLSRFYGDHLLVPSDNQTFTQSVLDWHTHYMQLVDSITEELTVSLSSTSAEYKLCVFVYTVAICLLLYYLSDNILAKSKLTPRRIRIWVCLLVVTATWTVLSLQLLVLAQAVEKQVDANVHALSRYMGELVYQPLDLTTYHTVLTYWRDRTLAPSSPGTLTVMGLVAVRDVTYYLSYYLWPVLTALLTPVLKLIVSLQEIYSVDVAKS